MSAFEIKRALTSSECAPEELSDKGIKILWTGGWDSTFRVLYANLVDGKRVEPHYIVDTARQSSLRELQAISQIRDSVRFLDEASYEKISNLRITLKSEIPDDIAITNSWARLKLRSPLGSQYDWLARYAESQNMVDLELSVHVDDKAYVFLRGKVERSQSGGYRLRGGLTGDENIFARFRFPILEYSKTRMRDIARRHGFIDILEKSWFCHRPINGVPCGMCSPCIYTIKEGMRYRLPRESLFRYHLDRCRRVIQSPLLCAEVLCSRLRKLR